MFDAKMERKLMENQARKRHGNQKVGHAILLLFAMKINDFRGLAGLRIHDNSCENRGKYETGIVI